MRRTEAGDYDVVTVTGEDVHMESKSPPREGRHRDDASRHIHDSICRCCVCVAICAMCVASVIVVMCANVRVRFSHVSFSS